MASIKARKILKRTLMGSSLALLVIFLLWLTARSTYGYPLFLTVAVLSFGAAFELGFMGSLASIERRRVFVLSALGAIKLLQLEIDCAEWRDLHPGSGAAASALYQPRAWFAYSWVLLIGAAVFGWLHTVSRWRALSGTLGSLLVMIPVALIIIYATAQPFDARPRLESGLALLALLSVCTLPLVWRAGAGRALIVTLALVAWLVPPLPGLWSIWRENGTLALVSLLLLSKLGDSAGYYVGSAIGKSHPFPNISPGKTTAGCVASLVAGTIAGGVLVAVGWLPREPLGITGGLLAGALINLAAQVGDILESWIKRRAGVKDSSIVLGPSGGVLDQIDSLLVSVPVAVLLWPWLFTGA